MQPSERQFVSTRQAPLTGGGGGVSQSIINREPINMSHQVQPTLSAPYQNLSKNYSSDVIVNTPTSYQPLFTGSTFTNNFNMNSMASALPTTSAAPYLYGASPTEIPFSTTATSHLYSKTATFGQTAH